MKVKKIMTLMLALLFALSIGICGAFASSVSDDVYNGNNAKKCCIKQMQDVTQVNVGEVTGSGSISQTNLNIQNLCGVVIVGISYGADLLGDAQVRTATVQSMLKELGYNPGPVDGIYGPKTRAAVREYQKDHNLKVDGIAGPNTLKSLSKEMPKGSYDGENFRLQYQVHSE